MRLALEKEKDLRGGHKHAAKAPSACADSNTSLPHTMKCPKCGSRSFELLVKRFQGDRDIDVVRFGHWP